MATLTNKIALVTGASRGIGKGIAIALGKEGATVIGTATTSEGAEKISQLFHDEAIKGCGMTLNVADPAMMQQVITEIKNTYGAISVLVNNAAVTQDNIFLRMKENEWLDVIQTDLNSVYFLSKACIKDMVKARWGRIINIGSVVGSSGNPGQVNYCAAKAGILGFSKALAMEVGIRDITVNTIAPGFIETDMTGALSEEQRQSILDRIPMQKIGTVADIAAAAVFLASPGAAYITGHTLHVNGGMYMS